MAVKKSKRASGKKKKTAGKAVVEPDNLKTYSAMIEVSRKRAEKRRALDEVIEKDERETRKIIGNVESGRFPYPPPVEEDDEEKKEGGEPGEPSESSKAADVSNMS